MRKNVATIIKYESEYLFLALNETNYNNSLVTGGIDDGEDPIESIKREIVEETGYFDIKSISPVDCINVSRFYVEHKGGNREAIYYPYLIELNSLKREEISDYEKKSILASGLVKTS